MSKLVDAGLVPVERRHKWAALDDQAVGTRVIRSAARCALAGVGEHVIYRDRDPSGHRIGTRRWRDLLSVERRLDHAIDIAATET